ncbi:MAG: 23S rRNA (uracil(1939)-C(5))-methyltransferase RlmD, partial [Oscillospiraceae bacterium]|nr:23S rRNA (uracil(1939)-C(5))-methyltransferase RlmD [Oscillospiraceae bacterium]
TETTAIFGNGRIRETLLGLSFDISLNTFLQVNHDQTEQLYSHALSFLDENTDAVGADLYCGAGTITLNAAKKCKKIYGIEIVPPAIKDARNNAKLNGIENAEFLCADCAEGFSEILEKEGRLDFVIVDPPRKGLVPSVIEDIAKSGAPKVIYVSCDPATLSRDISLFAEQGYKALSARPFDMFPQSGHVETVVNLVKE